MFKLLSIALTSALIYFPLLLNAAELDEVKQGLADDIQSSQQSLSALQNDIGTQRQKLSQEIFTLQNSVLDLRERAIASRRLADEETLSLSQIEERLEQWQDQSQYQIRLLQGFIDRTGQVSIFQEIEEPLDAGIEGLSRFLEQQDSKLYPAWNKEQVVMNDGQIKQADILQLGPVSWYRDEFNNVGLVSRSELNMASLEFFDETASGLQTLYEQGQGKVTFDPSLSTAILLAETEESVLEHVQKGGIWVIPILLFALFATLTAGLKAISLLRLPKQLPALIERLEKAYQSGEPAVEQLLSQVDGIQKELVQISIKPLSVEQRDDKLYACLLEAKNNLEKWLGAIALTAAVSPLLGLLGTVSGMISTFKLMTLFGSGDVNSVSGGISEALVTTELGLVVAIPALLAHALMSRKIKSYYGQLETTAIHLSQHDFERHAPSHGNSNV